MDEPVFADVVHARERIAPWAHRTPVLTSSSIDRLAGATVLFKAEPFQRTGSFKFRGATNAVLSLSDAERARGVVTHSSGNHAQALALAARLAEVCATIVMPEDALPAKRRATEGYGATVVLCAPTLAAREETAARVLQETRGTLIHPHDDPRVIAGQGTAAAELIEEAGPFDLLLAPVGGGGLLSGTAIAAAALLPLARVVGCEPAGADDAYRSLRSGVRVTEHVPRTVADGLRTTLGEIGFHVIRRLVSDIVLVSEEEILEAMRLVWERMKVVIEPSAAVAVAPLLKGSLSVRGCRVGVILSGGNVDLDGFLPSSRAVRVA
jgi:threonine dehydratase